MYYITTDTFDLLPDIHPDDWLSTEYLSAPANDKFSHCFISDDLIANLLMTLNLKGYITEFSCSGHLYTGYVDYIDSNISITSMTEEGFFAEVIPKLVQEVNFETAYISFDTSIKDIPDLKIGGLNRYWQREEIFNNKIVLRLKRNIVNRLRINDNTTFTEAFYKFNRTTMNYIEKADNIIEDYWPDYNDFIKNKEE